MVRFFLFEYEAGSVVLDALESVDGGVGKAREERVAVVNAGQNERDNKFGGGFGGKVFSDLTDATKMEVAGPGGGRDKVGHGKRAVKDDAEVLD